MRVILRRKLWAEGRIWAPPSRGAPIEMPESFRGKLPRDAVILEDPVPEVSEEELAALDEKLEAEEVEDGEEEDGEEEEEVPKPRKSSKRTKAVDDAL